MVHRAHGAVGRQRVGVFRVSCVPRVAQARCEVNIGHRVRAAGKTRGPPHFGHVLALFTASALNVSDGGFHRALCTSSTVTSLCLPARIALAGPTPGAHVTLVSTANTAAAVVLVAAARRFIRAPGGAELAPRGVQALVEGAHCTLGAVAEPPGARAPLHAHARPRAAGERRDGAAERATRVLHPPRVPVGRRALGARVRLPEVARLAHAVADRRRTVTGDAVRRTGVGQAVGTELCRVAQHADHVLDVDGIIF